MLTGSTLGKAIKSAIDRKGITQAALAREFKIKPPSIAGWISTGRISKPNFEKLRLFFADVVGPEHWDLIADAKPHAREGSPVPYYRPQSDEETWLIAAYRKADRNMKAAMLAIARLVLPECPTDLSKRRTGT